MWWFGYGTGERMGSVLAVAASVLVWWALYAVGFLYPVSMAGAFCLLCAAGVGLDRGDADDRRVWAWVMLGALVTLTVGVLVQ